MLIFMYGDYNSVVNDFNYEVFAQDIRNAAKSDKKTMFLISTNLAVCVVLREIAIGNIDHKDVVFEKEENGSTKRYHPRENGSFEQGVHFTVGATLTVTRQLAQARMGLPIT